MLKVLSFLFFKFSILVNFLFNRSAVKVGSLYYGYTFLVLLLAPAYIIFLILVLLVLLIVFILNSSFLGRLLKLATFYLVFFCYRAFFFLCTCSVFSAFFEAIYLYIVVFLLIPLSLLIRGLRFLKNVFFIQYFFFIFLLALLYFLLIICKSVFFFIDLLNFILYSGLVKFKAALLKQQKLWIVIISIAFYFIFFYSWFYFFNRTLALRKLFPWGHLGGFGPSNTAPFGVLRAIDVLQYNAHGMTEFFYPYYYFSMLALRWSFIYGSDAVYYVQNHPQILYILFAILSVFISSDKSRIGLFKSLSIFIIILTVVSTLVSPTSGTVVTYFNKLHKVGYFEILASVWTQLLMLFSFESTKVAIRSKFSSISFGVLLYVSTTLTFPNDLFNLFLSVETQAMCQFALFMLTSGKQFNRIKLSTYFIINVLASAVYVVGLLTIQTDFSTTIYTNISTVEGFNKLAYLLPAGLVIKICGVPMIPLFLKLYSRSFVIFFLTLVVLGETSQCMTTIKVLMELFPVSFSGFFLIWVCTVFVAAKISTAAANRARKTESILFYSTFQNILPPILVGILGYNQTSIQIAGIFFLITYTFSVALLVKNYTLKNPAFVAKLVIIICVLSLSGIPATVGFFGKLIFLTNISMFGFSTIFLITAGLTLWSIFYYGRLLVLFTVGILRTRLLKSRLYNSVQLVTLFILMLLLVDGIIPVRLLIKLCDGCCRFILSPVFESTDHRFALILSAVSCLSTEAPNKHIFYSLGETFWKLLTTHFLAGGDDAGFKHWFHAPFDGPLLPKYDSRYFWLAEVLSNPWQYTPNAGGSMSEVSNNIFRARGRDFRSFLIRWLLDSYIIFEYTNTRWLFELLSKILDFTPDATLTRLEPAFPASGNLLLLYGEAESFDKHVYGSLHPLEY